MNFTEAFAEAQKGKLIRLPEWKEQGKVLFTRPQDVISLDTCIENVKSLPASLKEYWKHIRQRSETQSVLFTEYSCLAEGHIVHNGYKPSLVELSRGDWEIVETDEITSTDFRNQ